MKSIEETRVNAAPESQLSRWEPLRLPKCFRKTKVWLLSAMLLYGGDGVESSLGQGVLHFSNHAVYWDPPVDSPVFGIDGLTPLAGAAYMAQLYAGARGTTASSLSPVDEPVPFRTGRGAGYWVGRVVQVPGIFAGQTATVQVRVWEAAAGSFEAARAGAGLYGTSQLLEIELGHHDFGLPPPLRGLESFSLVPEPGTISLGLFGCALLILAHRRSLKVSVVPQRHGFGVKRSIS